MDRLPDLLTAPDVASILRVDPKTIYLWASEDPPRLPAVRFGPRCVRFRPEDVERLIADRLAKAG